MAEIPKTGRMLFAILLILALAVLLAGGYATAYVALGEYIDWRVVYYPEQPMDLVERNYSQAWLTRFFEPAAYVESRWIGYHVTLTYSETPGPAIMK
jgi:hypothetical protein